MSGQLSCPLMLFLRGRALWCPAKKTAPARVIPVQGLDCRLRLIFQQKPILPLRFSCLVEDFFTLLSCSRALKRAVLDTSSR